ncbi:MAG: DUF2249 domain-containing protein [Thiohalomonadaceae bacterium]
MSQTHEHILDVSTLAAPEPLLLTLAAVEKLQQGEFLRMHHRMQPCHLYAELERRGYAHDTRRIQGGFCQVFIWRRHDALAETSAMQIAKSMTAWPMSA